MLKKSFVAVFTLSCGIMISGNSHADDVNVSTWQELNNQLLAGKNAIIQNDMTQAENETIELEVSKNQAGINGQGKTLTGNSSSNNTAIRWNDENSEGGNFSLYMKNVTFDGFSNSSDKKSGGTLDVISNNTNNNLTLDNVTIKNGSSAADDSNNAQGGALRNYVAYGQNLCIKNSLFENNKAIISYRANTSLGGAIYVEFSEQVNNDKTNNSYKIENTILNGNQSGLGGAIYIMSKSSNAGIPVYFSETNFENNTAYEKGGAIFNNGATINKISGSAFIRNSVPSGNGGAISNSNKSVINSIINSTFTENTANDSGGAILLNNESAIGTLNAVFEKNKASSGGAIDSYISTIDSITNSVFSGNTAYDDGGAIRNDYKSTINSITNSIFTGNTVMLGGGGAISNAYISTIDSIINSVFLGNAAGDRGGAIVNYGSVINSITDSIFSRNTANYSGGAIYLGYGSTIKKLSAVFENNKSSFTGGALGNNGKINISGSVFAGNTANYNGGAIYNYRTIETLNAVFKNNTANEYGGAIYNTGTINLVADAKNSSDDLLDEVLFQGNVAALGKGNGIYNTGQSDSDGLLTFIGNNNGIFTFYDDIYNAEYIDSGKTFVGNIIFAGDGTGTFNLFNNIGGTGNITFASDYILNMVNNTINVIQSDNLIINSVINMAIDVDLENAKTDMFEIANVNGSGQIVINNINLITEASEDTTYVPFVQAEGKETLAVNPAVSKVDALQFMYYYDVTYQDGDLKFVRKMQDKAKRAQDLAINTYFAGTQLMNNLLNSQVLNRDMGTAEYRNQGLSSGDYEMLPTTWVKAFGSKDNVELKNSYEGIDSRFYGMAGGADSRIFVYDNGIRAVYGVYAAYIGSKQKQNSAKVIQNGGYIGVSADFAKSGIFSRFAAYGGYLANEVRTAWGNDKFDIQTASVSNKTGYEINLGKYSLKPAVYTSYMYMDPEDYTGKAGVTIKNHTKNVFELTPEVMLSKDFSTGLDGYTKIAYTWNFYQGGKVAADDILLPRMSVKPYVEYGIGFEKDWSAAKENPKDVSSYAEINRLDGGRTGWSINAGLKIPF